MVILVGTVPFMGLKTPHAGKSFHIFETYQTLSSNSTEIQFNTTLDKYVGIFECICAFVEFLGRDNGVTIHFSEKIACLLHGAVLASLAVKTSVRKVRED